MRRSSKIAVGIAAGIGVAAIVLSMLSPFLSDCTTRKFNSAASPSGNKIAEHYETVCKADGAQKTEIHLIQDGARVKTDIGRSRMKRIDLAWEDEHTLVVSVPVGMEKAFDRPMQGVELKFRVVDDPHRPN